MISEEAAKNRRVFGAGLAEGMRRAGIEMENEVNPKRMNSLIEGLTSSARKVYDVVPIAEAWSVLQVCTELKRTGAAQDFRIVQGCLKSLHEQGLVQRHVGDKFQRIKEKGRTEPKETTEMSGTTITKISESDPVTVVSAIADHMRATANELRKKADQLSADASALETAALEATTMTSKEHEELQKLRSFKEALKNL